ncbi:MAG: hypothetical protein ACYC6Y_14525, partial [Thermoguttaceae bacterium]
MRNSYAATLCLLLASWIPAGFVAAQSQEPCTLILPEQRCLDIRSPGQVCTAPLPDNGAPTTVAEPNVEQGLPAYQMTLD